MRRYQLPINKIINYKSLYKNKNFILICKNLVLYLTSLITLSVLSSCDMMALNLMSGGNKVDILVPEKYKSISLKIGEEIEIPFKIANEQPDQKVKIQSSDPSIVDVISSKIGLIKALKEGQVVIKIFYSNKSKQISIKVS